MRWQWLLLIPAFVCGVSAAVDPVLTDRMDHYLQESLKNGYSCSALVAKKDQVLFQAGYGDADRERALAITSDTPFNIGSITKQFTAAAILKLAETGKLKTEAPLKFFFPDVPDDKKAITIHQLLTHTSGVSPATGGFRYDGASKSEFLEVFFNASLFAEPGTVHRYANANYIVLAAIIEQVSGQSYESYLAEQFWNPLEMRNTGYQIRVPEYPAFAHGYTFDLDQGVWKDWGTTDEHLPETDEHWYSIGKGDLYSTTEDLYRWHLALMNHEVLAASSVAQMETPFVAENESNQSFYGYGWAIFESSRGTKIVTHNGSNGIFFADLVRFVDEDVVVIVLSNVRLGGDSESVAWQLAGMVFDENYQPRPVAKLSYEMVYEFTRLYDTDKADELIYFLETQTGREFSDKRLFNQLGFKILRNEPTPAWGIELLKLNALRFPDDGNLWDSLGEAYYLYELYQEAAVCFEKAFKLAVNSNDHWRGNSEKRLKELEKRLGL